MPNPPITYGQLPEEEPKQVKPTYGDWGRSESRTSRFIFGS